MRGASDFDEVTPDDFVHEPPSHTVREDEGTSRPVHREPERLERFFNKVKEHMQEAMSGVCAKIHVIETKAKERDAAQTNHTLML